eukprot:217379-Rhodomonas_salina.1
MAIGRTCKHKSRYTVLHLGDYDAILGCPFQKFVNAKIEGDDCQVPSRRGRQTLPRWAAGPGQNIQLVRLSREEMMHEMNEKTAEESFVMFPQS